MSKRFTDGNFALGLVIGICLCLTFAAWVGLFSQPIEQPVDADHDGHGPAYVENYERDIEVGWWRWTGSLVTSSDTLAQWIMMAFTVGAVILVWRTLVATQAMVRDTREIGEAQVRAYLFCKSATFKRTDNDFTVTVEIGNTGQSPAANVRLNGNLIVHEVGGMQEHPRVLSWARIDAGETFVQPVISGGSTSDSMWFSRDFISVEEWDTNGALARATFDNGNEIWVTVIVSWVDVFNQAHEFQVEMEAAIDASPYFPDMEWRSQGDLELRMGDPRHKAIRHRGEKS